MPPNSALPYSAPYTLPLSIRKSGESFVVADASGVALAYVYFEDEPTRRGLVKRLCGEDARFERPRDDRSAGLSETRELYDKVAPQLGARHLASEFCRGRRSSVHRLIPSTAIADLPEAEFFA